MRKRIVILIFSILFILSIIIVSSIYNGKNNWICHGPFGGPVESIIVTDNSIYAGTFGSGVFKLNNNDKWISINNGLESANINALELVEETIYAGTTGGVYVYSNQSLRWSHIPLTTPEPIIYGFYYDEVTGKIYAYGDGIFVSTDGGHNWREIEANNVIVTSIRRYNQILLIGTHEGILTVDNEGLLKESLNTAVPTTNIIISDNSILVSTLGKGIYKSDDATEWENLETPNPLIRTMTLIKENGLDSLYVGTIDGFLYKSNDCGITWSLRKRVQGNSRIATIIKEPTNDRILVGTYKGIITSEDYGQKWNEFNDGITGVHVESLNRYGDSIVAATTNGIYIYDEANKEWLEKNKGLNDLWCTSLYNALDYLYIGTKDSGLYYTRDYSSYEYVESLGKVPVTSLLVTDPETIYVGSIGTANRPDIYISHNNGVSWISEKIEENQSHLIVYDLVMDQSKKTTVATTSNGIYYRTENNKWQKDEAFTDKLAFELTSDDECIYAASSDGLYKSYKNNSWERVEFREPVIPFLQTVVTGESNDIYVGSIRGAVYRSHKDNPSLRRLPTIPLADVKDLCYDYDNNRIIAGTVSSVWFLKP